MQNNPYNPIGDGRTLADAIQKEMDTIEELVDLGSEEEKELLLHSPPSTSSERFRKNSDGRLEMLVWSNTLAAQLLVTRRLRIDTLPKNVAVFDELKDLTLNKINRIPLTIKYLTKLERLKICESDSVRLGDWGNVVGTSKQTRRDVFYGIQHLNTLEFSLCSMGYVLEELIDLPYITTLKVDDHLDWLNPEGIIGDIGTMFRKYTEIDTNDRPALFFTLKTFVLTNSNDRFEDPNETALYVVELVAVLMQMFPNMQHIDLSACPAATGTICFGDQLIKRVRQGFPLHSERGFRLHSFAGRRRGLRRRRDREFPREQMPLWARGIHRVLSLTSMTSPVKITLPPNSIWNHNFVYEIIRNDFVANNLHNLQSDTEAYVSLVAIEDGIFEVEVATADNTHLVMEDFESRMVEIFSQDFERRHNKDMSQNQRALRILRTACQRAMNKLSTSTEAHIEIDSLHDGADYIATIFKSNKDG
mmetsp:Transcript_43559/g.105600  ORF Transcript_43559/g.105600 Transcript_43559/m.105600 type:complete len:475 (+) Transcript_43559:993-2417(+)|eukprot:CAMPEP_0113466278 /NCGR_PEP_ID=MMETSP0014_2-20120614/14184_1 /TAXON_ID=2857 /ORGANISM="Nitzschia sp." /LENGTH=474 /DNA_ID=CAMNT_0000358485 /DNA_START=859 /DNA_END=2283 /DNA_ORIENTATION=+ /assembly_acc=CAM_ASM_000159